MSAGSPPRPARLRTRAAQALLAALTVGGALAASSGPAGAQVRLAPESGGNFNVGVRSWSEIPFRTVVRQQFDFSCGSAAVATLLTYHYGRPTPERASFAHMWQHGDQAAIRRVGFSLLDMKNYLNGIGFRAEGFRVSTAQLQTIERPGIVLLDLRGYKHFVVVKGVANGRVLVGDPMFGLNSYSIADFERLWNGIFLAILDEGGRHQPSFNLASDWGPWSTAPLEQGALRVATGSLTTFLPPDYQISSELLLDMRPGASR